MTRIKIGNVIIEDVEVTEHGVIKKAGKEPRLRDGSAVDSFQAISSRTLRRLALLVYNLYKSGLSVGQIEMPVLVEYCKKELKCSARTAYNYANTIGWIYCYHRS